MEMFCRQCEQTYKSIACDKLGVCGKKPEVAILQDLLVHALKSLAVCGRALWSQGWRDATTDYLLFDGLFTTLTNVNFDPGAIERKIYRVARRKGEIKEGLQDRLPAIADWSPAADRAGLLEQGRAVGILADPQLDEDRRSRRELLLYGMKGLAAYADHAFRLGKTDDEVAGFFYKGLASLVDAGLGAEQLLGLVMECGRVNLKCMELLDRGHTSRLGHPQPTRVSVGHKKGPAIIVSGHDLPDLEELLKQTQGRGINIYTHGEMLPAHGYPGLKKYPHLAGHFGTAWQNQQREFNDIPACVLMTTNCLQEPLPGYADRIFTTGNAGWPGIAHIPDGADPGAKTKKDFGPVISQALALKGFADENREMEITVGFGHNAVISQAGQIVKGVKEGKLRRFFLIGGCDGARPGRDYFSRFAAAVPGDCVILTLACGKHRLNRRDYGEVAGVVVEIDGKKQGLPRLLDCGQCNDSYSAIKIAQALAQAFGCGVNDLPLSCILSWYEQKAVVILITLLSLGVRNIRLGPTLPAFLSANTLKLLVDKYNIQPIAGVEEDLALALAGRQAKSGTTAQDTMTQEKAGSK